MVVLEEMGPVEGPVDAVEKWFCDQRVEGEGDEETSWFPSGEAPERWEDVQGRNPNQALKYQEVVPGD